MSRNRRIELSTIIGTGSEVVGALKINGGVRIDGRIEGTVESNGIVAIGPSGIAEADITAHECIVSGRVTGVIRVKEGVELERSARVTGDIFAKIIKVHTGAIFNGKTSMTPQKRRDESDAESASEERIQS
ncbi:MAG: polymer-forming cytoskeletal protein [Candidatus Cloacimonetes bacterium]|nr:polymer-forming cytoskeletal protein [Candidatus Cloacimonadota bacterium]